MLAAWPAEVRPAPLHLPAELAAAGLRALAIRPGVAVFEAGREPVVRATRNDCIRVRGFPDGGGPPRILYPPEGRCFTEGARASLPWEEALLRSLLLRSPAPEAAIGDWACHGPRFGGGFSRVDVLWSQPWVDLRSGEEGTHHAAWFAWGCRPARLLARELRPEAATLRARGVLPGAGAR